MVPSSFPKRGNFTCLKCVSLGSPGKECLRIKWVFAVRVGRGVKWIPLSLFFAFKIHTDNVNADLCMISPPIDYLCLFWEICPPPPWALDLIRSHLKVTQASPRFVSKKHFADLGPHSLKLMVMKSCLTTAMSPELSPNSLGPGRCMKRKRIICNNFFDFGWQIYK